MADELECVNCGTDEHLAGTAVADSPVIAITCERCGLAWERDTSPACKKCGRTDVRATAAVTVDKSRGSQLSIQSIRVVYLCPACDPELLAQQLQTNSPLMPEDLPIELR